MIDKSKIEAGDEVKIERDGLVSKDWTEVTYDGFGDLMVGKVYLTYQSVIVTDHKPNLESYKAAIKAAQEKVKAAEQEVRDAVQALKSAENPEAIPVGTRVSYTSIFGEKTATVVEPPYSSVLDHNRVWIKFDDTSYRRDAVYTTPDSLKVIS